MSTATSQKLRSVQSSGGSVHVEQAISKPLKKKPNAPRSLDDTGQRYWREYAGALIDSAQLFETDLSTLEDLCYWESLKHRGRDELPKGSLFMEYTDEETGRVSHTQPHAAFSNLKSIQSTIMGLRGKLGLTVSDRSGLKVAKRFSNTMSGLKSQRDW